jgi:hypothetical protein
VRPPRGAPPPLPSPPQLSCSSPGRGGGTWSGTGRGSCSGSGRRAAWLPAHAARRNFVSAPQVWGPAAVCMCGAPRRPRSCPAPAGAARRRRARRKASEGRGPGRAGRGDRPPADPFSALSAAGGGGWLPGQVSGRLHSSPPVAGVCWRCGHLGRVRGGPTAWF